MGIEDRVKQDSERRRHARCEMLKDNARAVYCTGLFTFIRLGQSEANVSNLSESGVRIQTEERLKKGAKVRVAISIDKPKETFEAYGIVRNCYMGKQDSRIYAGIEFVDLDKTMKTTLKSMCDYLNSPKYKSLVEARKKDPLKSLEF